MVCVGGGGKRYVSNVCMYAALFRHSSGNNYPNCAPQGTPQGAPQAPQGKRSQQLPGRELSKVLSITSDVGIVTQSRFSHSKTRKNTIYPAFLGKIFPPPFTQ